MMVCGCVLYVSVLASAFLGFSFHMSHGCWFNIYLIEMESEYPNNPLWNLSSLLSAVNY